MRHSAEVVKKEPALLKVITMERLRGTLSSHLTKVVFQGSKSSDPFFYAARDFLRAPVGGEDGELPEVDSEAEPRQRISVNMETQVLLEVGDKGWCEHCLCTLPLKSLSTAGQPFV